MHLILIVVLLMIIIALAPAKIAVIFCALMVLIPAIVKYFAQSLVDVEVSFGDAATSVGLSLLFLFLAVLALLSAGRGTITIGPLLAALLFFAYSFGFKLGLGIDFKPSAIIAAASTVVSGVLTWGISVASS